MLQFSFANVIGCTAALTCDVQSPLERKDCGYSGISEAECRSRKCCWDKSIPGVKWCFHLAG